MSIVNFSIPGALDVRIKEVVKKKGFPSKAELFRYALMKYLEEQSDHIVGSRALHENPRISALTDELEEIVMQRLKKMKKHKI